MANLEHQQILKEGVKAWNKWREENSKTIPDLRNADLARIDFNGANLRGADLRDSDLRRTKFGGADLTGADLRGTRHLHEATLYRACLEHVNLSESDLSNIIMSGCDLRGADLTKANLRGSRLNSVNLREALLIGADLTGASLTYVGLDNARLSHAVLTNANLSGSSFSGADLSGADLKGVKNLSGANSFSNANLSEADLSKINLAGISLRGINLGRAKLHEAKLYKSDLSRAYLREAELSGADLRDVDFTEAYLLRACLRGADLTRADLGGATCEQADFTDATLAESRLINANLNGATLNGARLWETQRAGWTIKNVVCTSAYWNKEGKQVTTYGPGDFERLYAEKLRVLIKYPNGIDALEIVTLPALIQHLEASRPGYKLRLESIQDAPGGAVVVIVVDDIEDISSEQVEQFKAEIHLEAERKAQYMRDVLESERHTALLLMGEVKALERTVDKLLSNLKPTFYLDKGDVTVSEYKTKIGGNLQGAIGDSAHAHDLNFNQIWSQSQGSIDLPLLAGELSKLRQEMRKEATEAEHDMVVAEVAKAEQAAKAGDGPKTMEYLKSAGRWALDVSTKIGTSVAAEAIKKSMGG